MKPSYEELEEQLNRSRRLCDAALANERVWETAMMQACGEDGPKSVAEKFAALEAKCAALAAENAGMNTFVDALLSIAWKGGSADGADIQVLALKHGLLRQEVYFADEHENQVDDPGNFEDGDPVYFRVETQATDSFLAEVRALGVEMFAERKNNEMMSLHPDTHAVGSIAAEMSSQVKQLREFAAQLRKGVQS